MLISIISTHTPHSSILAHRWNSPNFCLSGFPHYISIRVWCQLAQNVARLSKCFLDSTSVTESKTWAVKSRGQAPVNALPLPPWGRRQGSDQNSLTKILYSFVRAATTKYHSLVGLNNGNVFSHGSGGCKSTARYQQVWLLRPLSLACRGPPSHVCTRHPCVPACVGCLSRSLSSSVSECSLLRRMPITLG